MRSAQRRVPQVPVRDDRAKGRPVLLATLDVPFDQDAVVFAVDSAVELGQPLIIANFVERAPLRRRDDIERLESGLRRAGMPES